MEVTSITLTPDLSRILKKTTRGNKSAFISTAILRYLELAGAALPTITLTRAEWDAICDCLSWADKPAKDPTTIESLLQSNPTIFENHGVSLDLIITTIATMAPVQRYALLAVVEGYLPRPVPKNTA
jgi:hypothetical protein